MTRAFPLLLALLVLSLAALGDDPKPVEDGPAPPETFRDDQREHWAYQPIARPEPPAVKGRAWVRNPIDRFILAGIEELEFSPSPEADRIALIRRVTFDLTGLPPTPEAVEAFLSDDRPDAYERLVDRLLASPRYGERWAQHWLDLAHYADSNGFELDAERPDAWRYRDWVVKALNDDLPYDRFVALQLAGDEVAPGDNDALIATGFGRCGPREVVGGNIDPAARRQSELTEITGTVGSVFLGLTMGCARCHDHKFDPLPTTDYYRLQSFFAAAQFVDRPIASRDEEEAFKAAQKEVNAKVAPLQQRLAELEAPYRKALRDKKEAMLTDAERAVLAIPAKDRTPIEKKMAMGAEKALNVTWEEVAEAVRANPEHHAERERLKREIHAIQVTLPRPPARAMALADEGKDAPETRVLRRGELKNAGPKVAPRPPGILLAAMASDAFPEAIESPGPTTGRRLALARWLTRPDNPLAARVIVNRLWQHHFGRGIVATPSDFGLRGEPPTHPELLDWLAAELIARGWRLKPIHRLMVTSATYRQSSSLRIADCGLRNQESKNLQAAFRDSRSENLDGTPNQRSENPRSAIRDPQSAVRNPQSEDPDNTMFWRMNRRRLEAEGLRDALLAASGELNPEMGGPGVLVPIEKEVEDLIFTEAEVVDLWPETPDPAEHARRSLYLFRKRNVRYPMFDAFDAPDTQSACARRAVSTHALQSLVLLNSDFAIDRARALAGRLYREAEGEEARIDRAYRIALARAPSRAEVDQARAFLASQAAMLGERAGAGGTLARPTYVPSETDPAEAAAWVDFALAMLNRNEFVYIP